MIEIIAVVVILVVIFAQNSRISNLEKIIKNSTIQKKSESAAPAAPASFSAATSPVVPAAVSPTAPSAPAVQRPVVETTPVNKEEVFGRLLGKIGIGAVIIGVAIFLNYAFDNNWIGVTGRVMIGVIIGLGAIVLGQFLRKKYLRYSDLLMGGGIAVLYLSMFSAHFYYHLISPLTAGIFMFIVTALAFAISIYNATPVLAVVSVIGGFATPFLSNSGTNSMFELFTYLTILNVGIMAVSFFKKWPEIIALAFIGTMINFVAWYSSYYNETTSLAPTMTFAVITFVIFLIASIARATTAKQVTDKANYILLGLNALGFAIVGYALLEPHHDGILGFASVLVALAYLACAFIVNKSNPEDKALNIFLPGLAVTFLSVAVPLQLSGPWIAVAWLVESVVLYVIASTISNRGFQVMGVVVYGLGLVNLFAYNYPSPYSPDFVVILNAHFLILILAVVVAYVIGFIYYRFGSLNVEVQKRGIAVFIIIANILTVYAVSTQIIFEQNHNITIAEQAYNTEVRNANLYSNGYNMTDQAMRAQNSYTQARESTQNRSHTYVSLFWILYAAVLTAIGFGKRLMIARRLGLILFIITALKVLVDVWSLGQLYRIVSFTVFGVVALIASFAYAKYKDRLKSIV
ncbi:MAG: DUF2339 domain-containing protein [Candidatus Taylorbacteria bacterium]|nr:DUF2339 domain-containing protein [Candidatus Taylorbacteria bacterium]